MMLCQQIRTHTIDAMKLLKLNPYKKAFIQSTIGIALYFFFLYNARNIDVTASPVGYAMAFSVDGLYLDRSGQSCILCKRTSSTDKNLHNSLWSNYSKYLFSFCL